MTDIEDRYSKEISLHRWRGEGAVTLICAGPVRENVVKRIETDEWNFRWGPAAGRGRGRGRPADTGPKPPAAPGGPARPAAATPGAATS